MVLADRRSADACEGTRVDSVGDRSHGPAAVCGARTDNDGFAHGERGLGEPEDPHTQPAAGIRRSRPRSNNISTLDENVLVERDADRLARNGALRGVALFGRRPAFYRLYTGELAVWSNCNRRANRNRTAFNPTRENATVVEFVDCLDRHSEWRVDRAVCWLKFVQCLEYSGAVVPHDRVCAPGNAIASPRGDWNDGGCIEAEAGQIGANFVAQCFEALRIEIDAVHLVYDHGNLTNSKKMQHVSMAPRLLA